MNFCKDCAHFDLNGICMRPEKPRKTNVVTGKEELIYCYIERLWSINFWFQHMCGKKGKYWKGKN